ncbi:thioredoxin [Candidatus Latescibacterota bacterium]
MSNVMETSDQTFETEVLQSNIPVVVDFWASWCHPCKMMAPILDEVSGNNTDKVKFLKLNTDENQQTAGKYNIMSIPSLVVFKDGNEIHRMIGVKPAAQLQFELDSVLAESV